jgi:molecular chaperone GrpE
MPEDENTADSPTPEQSAGEPRESGAREDPPATLEEAAGRIEDLAGTLLQKEEEVAGLRDGLLRERAELENFKKRMTRERSEALRYASEPLIRELLPLIDNLERALTAEGSADAVREGVEMVARQFEEILGRVGVQRLEARNQPFDPSEHEALAHVESTRAEPGHVLDEHLAGYRLHDRLLRPAQVTVAKAPGSEGN